MASRIRMRSLSSAARLYQAPRLPLAPRTPADEPVARPLVQAPEISRAGIFAGIWSSRPAMSQPLRLRGNTAPRRFMAVYSGPEPTLAADEWCVMAPDVSGPGGMTVAAELGEICEMCVEVGQRVHEDQIVARIETCKASVEARVRADGIVKEILVQESEEVWELQPIIIMKRLPDVVEATVTVKAAGQK
mmetsp:Transcript_11459/g.27761  ORF Transcript_11459/g.27761 Transcript_11459/m.27761 type:complete len:190 (+) Transcript_11459:151-720(+)